MWCSCCQKTGVGREQLWSLLWPRGYSRHRGSTRKPLGLGLVFFGYWPAFPLADVETNTQASGWLHLLDDQKRTPGSWVLLEFCYWLSTALNDSLFAIFVPKMGQLVKTKALVPRGSVSANFSIESWAVNFLWLRVLWLLDLEANTQSAQVAWLADFLMGMLQSWLVADWAIYWECTFQRDRGSRNHLEIYSNLSCWLQAWSENKTLEYSVPGRNIDCQGSQRKLFTPKVSYISSL